MGNTSTLEPTALEPTALEPATKTTRVEIAGLSFFDVLAALKNAGQRTGRMYKFRHCAYHVRRVLETYCKLHDSAAKVDSPNFLRSYFGRGAVSVTAYVGTEPTEIDIADYDNEYGAGLAQQVIRWIKERRSTDTRDLCRDEPDPVPLGYVLAVVAVAVAGLLFVVRH